MAVKDIKKVPELLSPAGDFERLKYAVKFGADAVYLGGISFGMRTSPSNFTFDELGKAVDYAHEHGVKVYLTCNTLPHNDEIGNLPEFIKESNSKGVDAFIVSDIGVLSYIKKYAPNAEIHISTQAGIVNYAAANAFYEMGAKRVVLARELTLDEIADIRAKTDSNLEIECFVHGSMCVSFSGRCLLSDYLTGRDSNRGDCAQPCRWKYHLMEETRPGEYYPIDEDDSGAHILNAKDLCMIEHIPELVKAGISSFKIEGRAKSLYYTSVTTNAYRCAIDGYLKDRNDNYKPEKWILDEMNKVSHRQYSTGFYYGRPKKGQIYDNGGYIREYDIAATAENYDGQYLTVIQRNKFLNGDELEVLEPGEEPFRVIAEGLADSENNPIDSASHAMMTVKFKCGRKVENGAILRKQRD